MLATFLVGLFSFVFLNIPIAFSLILVTLVLMYFMGNISPLIISPWTNKRGGPEPRSVK